ncbi:MAG: EAL domain-containing protein [Campylobacterales bacterium]|nr:EAL domain-containing protein [Campylobacterales bacterium]
MDTRDLKSVKSALNISFIYLICGVPWIYFSDFFVVLVSKNATEINLLQNYKGWFFIVSTALLLYFLNYRFFHKRFIEYTQHISEQKKHEIKIFEAKERFDRLAHFDTLTNLPNRLSLTETLKLKTFEMEDHPFALFFLDLDGFKEINDSYGHRFGDELLIRVSYLLQEIFPPETFIVRTGGDEFVILLSCQKNQDIINLTMNRLIEILNHPLHIEETDVYITASIGIVMYPNDANNAEELLQKADAAMYNAKRMGKNTFSFYTQNLTLKALQQTTMTTNLKKALQNGEFSLYYQPQIDPENQKILGMEALLRWFSPTGLIAPSLFIPVAEDTGLILEIGELVLREGCKTATRWHEEGILQGRIAINVSARQLIHPNFISILEVILEETNCNPQWLELEITESSILENPEKIIALLWVIKSKGFYISIDDFGTGYSSLSYLKNLPIDKLKIDISFVRNVTHEPKNQIIVKTIIALAKGLNMQVLAEGVESEEELEFLRKNDIDSIQGYYYHKPMASDVMEELLRNIS